MSLREIKKSDLELMLKWRNHPDVRLNMFSKSVIEFEQHRLWFERESKKDDSIWLMFLDEYNVPHGIVYFKEMNESLKNAYWGFYSAPSAPKGTGTKMGYEALNYYFYNLGFHKLNAEVLESNCKSYYFHKKLGFQIEGTLRDNYLGCKGYEDIIFFGLIDCEWKSFNK